MATLRRRWMVGVLLAASAFFLACSPEKESTEQTKISHSASTHPIYAGYRFGTAQDAVRVGIQPLWFPTALITEAMKRDHVLAQALDKMGRSIRFYSFLKGEDLNYFMERGDLDAGVAGDMPTLSAASAGAVVPILIHQGFIAIIARRPMLLTELRGEPIGYAHGASAHYALLEALDAEGMAESDVGLITMDITEMPAALRNGRIAAFTSWEPNTAIILRRYPKFEVVHRSLFSGYMYFRGPFKEKAPAAAALLMASECRAFRWILANRSHLTTAADWALTAAERLTGRKPAISPDRLAAVAEKDLQSIGAGPVIPGRYLAPDGDLYEEFRFLQSIRKIPASIQWADVEARFKSQTIRRILSKPKAYGLDEFDYRDSDR